MSLVKEVFTSVNGEINPLGQGSIQMFVRFRGCNLRCPYCDTKDTQPIPSGDDGSLLFPSDNEFNKVIESEYPVNFTGGEPALYQDSISTLIRDVKKEKGPWKQYIFKSNGTISLKDFSLNHRSPGGGIFDTGPSNITFALDYKQGVENGGFHPDNFGILRKEDVLNFPVQSFKEFLCANEVISMYREMGGECTLCMSPIKGDGATPEILLEHMLTFIKPKYKVYMNIQTHKQAGLR